MKNKLKRYSLLIAFIGSLIIFGLRNTDLFTHFEDRSIDLRLKIRGPNVADDRIVIAGIDDESLQTVGKWPWPRRIHAKLLDICKKAGASVVVFDVVFYEPDRYDPSNDRLFEQAIKKNNRVISAFNFKLVDEQIVEPDEGGKSQTKIVSYVVKETPIPEVTKPAAGLGFVNAWQDSDGYLRRARLTYDFEGVRYYALNLRAVSVYLNMPPEEIIKGMPLLYDSYVWDDPNHPTKEALINWRGPEAGTFQTYSCAKLLDTNVPDEWKENWLKGKIVLIGSTALGLYDHFPTPFSGAFPGLYFHANAIDNLLKKAFLTSISGKITIFLIFVFGLWSGFIVPRTNVWLGAFSSLMLAALYWFSAYFLMANRLVHIELVTPLTSFIGNYLLVFFYRFIVEQREKAGIKKAFGVYVNPHVVEQIAKNPDALKLGGEQREMSVMFSDVAGFTTISEKLTPQELVQLLNLYLTAMTDTIMRHDGTVDKYEGDAIMAFWGAPLLQPDHAKQACFAVLENRERLKELNQELEKTGMQKLFARCGINTGLMNVGNMGSSQKFNYTVMGDSVNLASRLEGANKQYDSQLMISEFTYEKVKNEVEVRELDLLRVKGKKIPIKVFELVSKKNELTDAQKKAFELYHEGLTLYRKRNFKQALNKLQMVSEHLMEDGPTETYIKRSRNFIESPPAEDWDGVYVMTTK